MFHAPLDDEPTEAPPPPPTTPYPHAAAGPAPPSPRPPNPPGGSVDTGSTRCSGDDDAASSVETGSKVPSFCGSDASGPPGDVAYKKDLQAKDDILMLPDGEDPQSYGEIKVALGRFDKVTDPLLGDGYETAVAGDGDGLGSQSNAQQKGPRGTFGVVQGNWGQPGTVVNAERQKYLFHDLKSGPGTFICL